MPAPVARGDVDRLWQLVGSICFCMLCNWDGARLHSRPMGAFAWRDEGAIYFFADARTAMIEQILKYPRVCLAFAGHGQKYVSISGIAEVNSNLETIKALWAAPAKVWWKTPDNPHIRLIKVTPLEAEFWDTPGYLIASLKTAFALATGGYPKAGQHKKVAL